jgi:hypothetical protein
MKAKQAIAVALSVAAIAAWIAVARSFCELDEEFSRSAVRPRNASINAGLDVELERLTPLHTVPPAAIRPSHRNPFRFKEAPRPSIERVAERPEVQSPLQPASPALQLAGIAESAGADGPVRTAIVSTPNELFMVKVGDRFATRYRVDRIGADAVELQDGLTGQPITIGMR